MRKIIFILIAVLATAIMACNKNASKPNSQSVEVRIENAAKINFSDVIFNEGNFGTLPDGSLSEYKSFRDVTAYPGARIVLGKDTMWAGMLYCGTPPLPMLENGRYTLKIFYDEEWLMYNARFIEE